MEGEASSHAQVPACAGMTDWGAGMTEQGGARRDLVRRFVESSSNELVHISS